MTGFAGTAAGATVTAIAFPYALDGARRTAVVTDPAVHIRQMLEQVLFTNPGERVNRPDFGCGLLALAFEPNSTLMAAGLTVTVTASIQQWLGDVMELTSLDIDAVDSTLSVTIGYRLRLTSITGVAVFTAGSAP